MFINMKQLFSILLGFLPWIVFGVISGPSLWRLNAAIIVALSLVPIMGYKQLAKVLGCWCNISSFWPESWAGVTWGRSCGPRG